MLTAAQYDRAWKSHINRPLLIVTVMLFAWQYLSLVLGILEMEAAIGGVVSDGMPWFTCGGMTAGYLALFLAAVVVISWQRKATRDERLHCPECWSLLARLARVKKTGRCYRCGEVVLDGAAPPDLKPRSILEAAALRREKNRPWEIAHYVWLAISGFAMIAFLFWLMLRQFPNSMLKVLGIEVLLFFGWSLLSWPLMRRVRPDPQLDCPHCGKQLSIERVRSTNCCWNCGRTAVSDPVIPVAHRVSERSGVEPPDGSG